MPVEMLEHYTIRCASLERTRDFYRDVIGLSVGERPRRMLLRPSRARGPFAHGVRRWAADRQVSGAGRR